MFGRDIALSIDDLTRRQLALLARRPRARQTVFSSVRPTKWQPEQVSNPLCGMPFTDASAWDLVASRLEEGHEVEVVTLRKPPGATGYVMRIKLDTTVPTVYVKLELGAGRILGRSFHYTWHE